jgi:hypothetical protein
MEQVLRLPIGYKEMFNQQHLRIFLASLKVIQCSERGMESWPVCVLWNIKDASNVVSNPSLDKHEFISPARRVGPDGQTQ